jgi:transposase
LPGLFADESASPVLDHGRGRTKAGPLWAYADDDRSWGGSDPLGVACIYALYRKAERPIAHLEGFKSMATPATVAGRRRRRPAGVLLVTCTAGLVRTRTRGPSLIVGEALGHIVTHDAVEKKCRMSYHSAGRSAS